MLDIKALCHRPCLFFPFFLAYTPTTAPTAPPESGCHPVSCWSHYKEFNQPGQDRKSESEPRIVQSALPNIILIAILFKDAYLITVMGEWVVTSLNKSSITPSILMNSNY